jgi:hypothetical protein
MRSLGLIKNIRSKFGALIEEKERRLALELGLEFGFGLGLERIKTNI